MAIEAFRGATNAAPRYAPAWRGLGIADEQMGRKSEALNAYEQYLMLSSGEDARVVREIEQKVESSADFSRASSGRR
jgi:Flp pilus assembly protein TadD